MSDLTREGKEGDGVCVLCVFVSKVDFHIEGERDRYGSSFSVTRNQESDIS